MDNKLDALIALLEQEKKFAEKRCENDTMESRSFEAGISEGILRQVEWTIELLQCYKNRP